MLYVDCKNKLTQKKMEILLPMKILNPYPGLKELLLKLFLVTQIKEKIAKTTFKVLETNDSYSVGLAFPKKQDEPIKSRVHAKVHGHPLIGDKLYLGGYPLFQRFKDNIYSNEDCDEVLAPRHFLHAFSIKIKDQTFHAPLGEDMQNFYIQNFNGNLENLFQRQKKQLKIISTKILNNFYTMNFFIIIALKNSCRLMF